MPSNRQDLFDRVFSDYSDKIYHLCCSYASNEEDRKDLHQDILLRVWKSLPSFKNQSAIGTWVFRVAVNASIDRLRKSNRRDHLVVSSHIDDLAIPDRTESVENAVISNEKIRTLYRCINGLSFLDKTLVSLYLEEMSYGEIADVVGMSRANVGVRLHRIKKR